VEENRGRAIATALAASPQAHIMPAHRIIFMQHGLPHLRPRTDARRAAVAVTIGAAIEVPDRKV
jgi:hypothetical protein